MLHDFWSFDINSGIWKLLGKTNKEVIQYIRIDNLPVGQEWAMNPNELWLLRTSINSNRIWIYQWDSKYPVYASSVESVSLVLGQKPFTFFCLIEESDMLKPIVIQLETLDKRLIYSGSLYEVPFSKSKYLKISISATVALVILITVFYLHSSKRINVNLKQIRFREHYAHLLSDQELQILELLQLSESAVPQKTLYSLYGDGRSYERNKKKLANDLKSINIKMKPYFSGENIIGSKTDPDDKRSKIVFLNF